MPPSASPSALPNGIASDREDRIRHLPAEARAAYQRFQATGSPVELDVVIFAILEDFVPRSPERPLAGLPGETRLIDDLGFDSLAITEVVFFMEDLFGIGIANKEIVLVRTLEDLRRFILQKVSARATD